MARVLVTGMSGTGKSTLLAELSRRGHHCIDTDYDGWVLPSLLWDVDRMTELLASHPHLVVSGTVANQGSFAFDSVVLLSAPLDVLLSRVAARTNNPYGRTPADQDLIRQHVAEVEPLLRASATVELDARRTVEELADAVERLLG